MFKRSMRSLSGPTVYTYGGTPIYLPAGPAAGLPPNPRLAWNGNTRASGWHPYIKPDWTGNLSKSNSLARHLARWKSHSGLSDSDRA